MPWMASIGEGSVLGLPLSLSSYKARTLSMLQVTFIVGEFRLPGRWGRSTSRLFGVEGIRY